MFFFKEPILTMVLPEVKECSEQLSSLDVEHIVLCDIYHLVLHCYVYIASFDHYTCQYFIIYDSFNLI